MSWSGWPPSTGDDVQSWGFLKQAYYALRERAQATGQEHWPKTNNVWLEGTVTGATNTSITDSTQDFGGSGKWPWTVLVTDISTWDVIIDVGGNTDPRLIVRATISSWTSTVLTVSSVADYIAEGIISSASDLVGKRYFLIKNGGLWWPDRWMKWPNDELDHGTATSATTSSITETDRKWTTDQWKDKHVVTHTVADGVKRVTITGNTADTLSFSTQSWTPTGTYSIVNVNTIAIPGRTPGACFKWADSYYTRNYKSHLPDGTIGSAALPALSVTYSSGTGGGGCTSKSFDIFDRDWWSGLDEECSTKDKSYNEGLFRTIRGLQVGAANLSGSFVDPTVTYDGYGKKTIRNMTEAEWFAVSGINSVSVPYTNSSEASQTIYYATIQSDGSLREAGTKSVAAGSSLSTDDVGKESGDTTVASKGWTRSMPREFRMMYDHTAFIPDTDLDGPINPPVDEDGKAGTFQTRAKSTKYKEHDQYGLVIDGGVPFVNGDVARFSGDNWNDGNIGNTSFQADDDLIPFWGRQNESVPPDGVDTVERMGTASDGGAWWLEDDTKNWWDGTAYTHTGTASGGGTTSLADSSKSGSFMWGNTGGQNRFAGFILEITAGANAGLRVPITGYTPATQTVSFAAVSGFSPTGQTYRIREPFAVNRWKDSVVRITKADGTTIDATITHNDDTRLYFAAQSFSTDGLRYQIIRHSPGGCWLRSSGAWVKPTGTDARNSQPWPDDQSTILPTIVTRYGRMMKGDYITSGLFSELQEAINKLKWTQVVTSWTSRADAGTPENNAYIAETYPGNGTGDDIYAAYDAAIDSAYNDDWNVDTEYDNSSPRVSFIVSGDDTTAPPAHASARIEGRYAYGKVANVPPYISCSIDWLAYSQLNAGDSDESESCINPPGPAPEANVSVLFADGGSPAKFRQWAVYDSTGSSTDENRRSAKFNVSLPPTGNDSFTRVCGPSGTLWSLNQGFIVTSQLAIAKWSMSYV